MKDQDILLDTKALERMGLGKKRTIDGWRRKGKGPRFIRLSHHMVRYRLADVRAFLASRTFGGDQQRGAA